MVITIIIAIIADFSTQLGLCVKYIIYVSIESLRDAQLS